MSVQKPKNTLPSLQQYIKISEIKDNTVILKDGCLRAVLKINAVNFELKSEQEQNSLIYSYQEFLNTLEFPIQILIKSKKLDIEGYLEKMKEIYINQPTDLLKRLTANYIEYVSKLVEVADIMQKEFYCIVPVDPIALSKGLNPFQKLLKTLNPKDTVQDYKNRTSEIDTHKKKLEQRVQSIINGLSNIGLKIERLDTYELVELYYKSYNPELTASQSPRNLQDIDVDMVASQKITTEEE